MLHGRAQTSEQWSIVGDFFWRTCADDGAKQVKLARHDTS
jgi:hypothetical protein